MKQVFKTTLAAVLGGFIALGTYTYFDDSGNTLEERQENTFQFTNYTTSPSIPLESIDFVEAANRSLDAVVHVKTVSRAERYYNPWSRFFGGEPYTEKQSRGSGSGVIISDDGYIVTNNHVITNAEQIEVVTNNNRVYRADLIGADPSTDIALLKINEENMPSIVLGDSDILQVGEWVLAVGNPFNLTSTVTAGIVSAKARNINILDYDPNADALPLESFIQTDAAVNPGNSGGALVNGRGELVGINTAIASRTGSYSGYSFAVPVSIVKKVTADLLEFGRVQRAYIGVNISNIDPTLRKEENLRVSEGAYVRGVLDQGAAADAGIKEGDIIVGVQDYRVKNVTQLQEQIGKYRPGDEVRVTVLRDNNEKVFNVTLRDRFGSTELKKRTEIESNMVLGARLRELSEEEKAQLNIGNGVKITELTEGKLMRAGLPKGFIITHIDKEPVNSPEEVSRILRSKTGGVLLEGLHENGMPDYYGFGV